jgi:hypothetical protein
MQLKNKIYSRLVIASVIVLIIINLVGLALSIHDLFYLKKIISGKPVLNAEHIFFIEKNKIQYWVTVIAYLTYLILFLTWFYRAYKNVHIKESEVAPFKPGIVPFSYIIPILNFYGPYKIMRFIWWGNAFSIAELNRGYKTINAWWLLTILSFIMSRITAAKYKDAVYADAFMVATYFHLFVYALVIHFLILTLKLVKAINKNENTPPVYMQAAPPSQ